MEESRLWKPNISVSSTNDSLSVLEEVTEISVEDIMKLFTEVIIVLFGIIGNVLVIIVIKKLGKKKKNEDNYLQNLAIADIGVLLLAFPLVVVKEKKPLHWPFGEFVCRYLYPVPELSHGASIWFIVVIAVERYCKLVALKSHGINRPQGLQRAKIIVACIWMLSFLIFCLPLYFVVDYLELPSGGASCGPNWSSLVTMRVYVVLVTFLSYILPLITISMTYTSISRTIRRSSVFNKAITSEQHGLKQFEKKTPHITKVTSIRLRQNKRARKIITPLAVVFAITMLPLNCIRLALIIWPSIVTKRYYDDLLFALAILVILNSSLNPVIYSVVSKAFRLRIKNLFVRG